MTRRSSTPSRSKTLAGAALAAILALGALAIPPAAADTVDVSGHLPTARNGTSSVWDGAATAYVFGGSNSGGALDDIVAFTPANGNATVVGHLPTARTTTSAVWDGAGHAYVFGGYVTGVGASADIVRYTPATGEVLVVGSLPTARAQTSAVWDGAHAFIFGGQSAAVPKLPDIVRYTPATGEVVTLAATLPTGRHATSAVWDGTDAYVFGGWDAAGSLGEIVRFTPATPAAPDAVNVMGAAFSPARRYTGAAWDGAGHAYILAGSGGGQQIDRYTPKLDALDTMTAQVPSARTVVSAVWGLGGAHLFGGDVGIGGPYVDEIVTYVPRPTPAAQANADNSYTLYDDHNGDGDADAGEGLATTPADADGNGLPDDADAAVQLVEDARDSADQDGDQVPDALEAALCDRSLTSDAIAATAVLGHSCANGSDYVPPAAEEHAFLPTGATAGADADGDGLPSTVTLDGVMVSVDPFRDPVVLVTPAAPSVQTIDAQDDDPDQPAASSVTVEVPAGWTFGPDADYDRFPASVTVTSLAVTVDRTRGHDAVTTAPGSATGPIYIDTNDNNANSPVGSTASATYVTGVDVGPDADHDGVPSRLLVHQAKVTVDKRSNRPLYSFTGQPDQPVTLDGNDNDPDTPAPADPVTVSVPLAVGFGPDADSDDVPASFLVTYEDVTVDRTQSPAYSLGTHTETVANPLEPNDNDDDVPVTSQEFTERVPILVLASGDADGDYVPASVTTTYLRVRVDRSEPSPVAVGFESETSAFPGENDAARDSPVPWSAFDADGDQLPDALEFVFCEVEAHSDPSDGTCPTPTDYEAPADVPNPWRV